MCVLSQGRDGASYVRHQVRKTRHSGLDFLGCNVGSVHWHGGIYTRLQEHQTCLEYDVLMSGLERTLPLSFYTKYVPL